MATNTRDMSRICCIVMAGRRGSQLHELTERTCKSALPFVGGNRLIDFSLRTALLSQISTTTVMVQYRPETLKRHMLDVWAPAFVSGELIVRDGGGQVQGTASEPKIAHALARQLHALKATGCEIVLTLPGDEIYELDSSQLLAAHNRSGADVTVAVSDATLSRDQRLRDAAFLQGGQESRSQMMGACVFNISWLLGQLSLWPETSNSDVNLTHEIARKALATDAAHAWSVPGIGDQACYWRDVNTLDAYRSAHLDFEATARPCRLPRPAMVDTKATAALQYSESAFTSGGTTLRAPILRPDLTKRWTYLDETVVLPGAHVMPGARLSKVIVAPNTIIPSGFVIGEDPEEDARWFRRTQKGTVLVTTPMLARRAALRDRKTIFQALKNALPFTGNS